MNAEKISAASIYIPSVQKWASITGACMYEGEFRLIYKTDDNYFGLMSLDTVQTLIKCFPVPF